MLRDAISVEYGTSLEDAWALLLKHRIKALPVVNSALRLVGMVTQSDMVAALYRGTANLTTV